LLVIKTLVSLSDSIPLAQDETDHDDDDDDDDDDVMMNVLMKISGCIITNKPQFPDT
jgi:hypothetical protein